MGCTPKGGAAENYGNITAMSAKKILDAAKREQVPQPQPRAASRPKVTPPSGREPYWHRFGAAVRHIIRHNPDLLAKGAE